MATEALGDQHRGPESGEGIKYPGSRVGVALDRELRHRFGKAEERRAIEVDRVQPPIDREPRAPLTYSLAFPAALAA